MTKAKDKAYVRSPNVRYVRNNRTGRVYFFYRGLRFPQKHWRWWPSDRYTIVTREDWFKNRDL